MRKNTIINYQVNLKGGYGARLSETFNTFEEALDAIEETTRQQITDGYTPDEYYVTLYVYTKVVDDNGDIISESSTTTRIY